MATTTVVSKTCTVPSVSSVPHRPDLGERELEAHREQQKGDAEPPQGADILDARNQPQPVRADNRSDQQVADDRRDAQPAEQGYGDDRREEEDQNFVEELHCFAFLAWASVTRQYGEIEVAPSRYLSPSCPEEEG